jgi:hypothetical protein
MSSTTSISPITPSWYRTVSDFSHSDMRAHPSTDDVAKYFTNDAQFFLKEGGEPHGIEAFRLVYPIACQADVEAIGKQKISFKQISGIESFVKWKFSGQQLRNGYAELTGKGWYHIAQTAHIYLREVEGVALIYKYVIVKSESKKLEPSQDNSSICVIA